MDRIVRYLPDTARQELGWYVRNCVFSPAVRVLENIVLGRLNLLKGLPDPDDDENEPDLTISGERRRLMRELRHVLKEYAHPGPDGDSLKQNTLYARDEFSLDAIDTEILLFLLRYQRNKELENFADEVAGRLRHIAQAVAVLIGADTREVHRRIMPDGALISSGAVSLHDESSYIGGRCGCLQIAPPLRKVMFRSHRSREEWAAAIFGLPLDAHLAWSDFDHLEPARDLAARLLSGGKEGRARGINLLVHGPVGTGKTEFCKSLAARCGLAIWSVGETDEDGGEPNRMERLAALRLAQRLLKQRAGALILFDEAEDLLGHAEGFFGRRSRGGQAPKIHVNRFIEQNPVPVLWTCNDVDLIDPAVLRRMTLAVEIGTPTQPVRARIWRRVLADLGLSLDDDAVRRLSGRYETPPAVAANAARAAALAGGGERDIEQAMGGVLKVLRIGPRALDTDGRDFDPRMVNCCDCLEGLVERLGRPQTPRNWSLCLHGAPGTGKSLFARHLAGRLGLPVMQERASDLLSMWVGESEKEIANAFAAARTQGAMLVIDEADSLLADRRGAVRSWEVTQVNEMLTWMETRCPSSVRPI